MLDTKEPSVTTAFKVTKVEASRRSSIDYDRIRFGDVFADHMFEIRYKNGNWSQGEIMPYGPIELMPSANILHYGQGSFEGMKAFRYKNSEVSIFRIDDHYKRFANSCKRMNIPEVPKEIFRDAIVQLVDIDRDWVPNEHFKALYLRPFVIATEEFLGVKPSRSYRFYVITGPVGSYYSEGIKPIRLTTMPDYVRAVKGGVGDAKVPGNYAASLKPTQMAMEQGYAQVLWLDALEREYVEEVGAMNMFFVLNGKLITSKLTGTILPGITRKTVIELARGWGIDVEERLISIYELIEGSKNGTLTEAFGSGTAAVISPVGYIKHLDEAIQLDQDKMGPIAEKMYNTITRIHHGDVEDNRNWCTIL